MGKRPNLKLSEETGKETRDALKKCKDAYDLDSQEEVIRQLLPKWAFNPLVPPKTGRIKDMTEGSLHYDLDLSSINTDELSDIRDEAEENGNTELVSEIEDILQSHSSEEESE